MNGAFSRGISSFADTESSTPKPIATEISNPATPTNMLRCHLCQKVGHLKTDCKARFQTAAIATDRYCFYCRKKNHSVEDCWDRKKRKGQNTVAAISEVKKMSADLRQNKPMNDTDHCSSHNQLQLKCGCSLPLMSAACSSDLQKHRENANC